MRRSLLVTIVLIGLVPVVWTLVLDAASGTEYQRWAWPAAIGLVVAAVIVELRRNRSGGQSHDRSRSENRMTGTVYGTLVMAKSITGQVTIRGPSDLPGRDPLAEAADQLAQAVGARWRREEEHRKIQNPFPLPVRWRLPPEELTDHWANIARAPAGATADPLALTGQLDEVVDIYRRIPSGRLVVLGRAGSGKTILTLRFVLDLVKTRNYPDPVPVIFSLGSWNPTTMSLREWLAGQLMRDDPGLVATGPGNVPSTPQFSRTCVPSRINIGRGMACGFERKGTLVGPIRRASGDVCASGWRPLPGAQARDRCEQFRSG